MRRLESHPQFISICCHDALMVSFTNSLREWLTMGARGYYCCAEEARLVADRKSSCYRSSANPRVHTKCVSVVNSTVYIVFAGFQFSTIVELCHLARVLKHNLGAMKYLFLFLVSYLLRVASYHVLVMASMVHCQRGKHRLASNVFSLSSSFAPRSFKELSKLSSCFLYK